MQAKISHASNFGDVARHLGNCMMKKPSSVGKSNNRKEEL